MASINPLRLSELGATKRLDAEYYRPAYLEKIKILESIETKRLKELAYVTDGEHGSPIFDEGSGIKYFSAKYVRDGYIDPTDVKYTSRIIDQRNKRSRLQLDDVLLSTTGTIGFAGLVTDDMLPANTDRDVARIEVRQKQAVDPAFLVAFLNCKYGRAQTLREATGNVQLHLFLRNIRELLIPLVDHSTIAKLQREAIHLIEKSRHLYRRAEDLLKKELSISDLELKNERSYENTLLRAFGAQRLDAEYFQPLYKKILSLIIDYPSGFGNLLSFIEDVKADFSPNRYPSKLFKYVELSDVDASIGVVDSFSRRTGEDAPDRAKRILKRNDVIVSRVEGSLVKVALVRGDSDGCLASTGFFQFRPTSVLPEVLLVLSKSMVLQQQLKRECAGTILTAVPSQALKRILLPAVEPMKQRQIASLVDESHKAKEKAHELLNKSKRAVESVIEQESTGTLSI